MYVLTARGTFVKQNSPVVSSKPLLGMSADSQY